jgi:RNA polymerase sigma factor (sigma-70 family)
MFDDEDSQALAALREANYLIINRAFDKRDAKEHLNWYIELCKSEARGVSRFFWVPVYGDKRGLEALQAIRADGIPVEFIENVNRLVAGEVLKDYERMFWKEAWLVARQYNLPQRVIGDMSRNAYAEFVCRDLYNAGFVKALEMAPGYDPERGITLGAFVQARARHAMHDYMRETANNIRVPRGQQFIKEISRDIPGKEYLGADRNLGEHTEWEKFVALLDVDWRHQIAESIHAAVARGDMPERWGRILELRFLCKPDRRLTLDRIGKLLGIKKSWVHEEQQRAIQAAGALLDPAIRRLREFQQIFWEANNYWRLWGRRLHGRPELFEERIEQITLQERTPSAPQNVATTLADREKSLERPDQTDAAYNQLKARTGKPDWQPKAKARYERQRIGLLFPCSKNHLAETVEQAIATGHSVRCWRMRRWIWETWEHHRRKPVVLVDHVAVHMVMRGSEKSWPSDRKNPKPNES